MMRKVPKEYINVAVHLREPWLQKKAKRIEKGSVVIDVGAGECPYKDWFSHCQYYAQDFAKYEGQTEGPLKESWDYGDLDIVSDILKIPLKDKVADVVVCTEVLEHVPDPIRSIEEMCRLLKPRGKILITAPLASGLHQEPYHFYGGFTPHFYKKFLSENRMEVKEIMPLGGLMKHVAQELFRVSYTLKESGEINRLEEWVLGNFLVNKIGDMEKDVFIPEFTIGYAIEAVKK